ncbi:MAG: hypothetical protein FJY77_05805 [Candidatus Altiarchaeales archaeon]|nr:hypothetical protein [Candidatus Altiarchaeales archaeon]
MKKCVLFLAFLLLAPCVSAKYITISVMPLSSNFLAENLGEVNFSISNLGDEPAYDMSVGLIPPKGISSDKVYLGVVNQGASNVVPLKFNVSDDVLPGEYYMNLMVQYADANGYPFSMVNPMKIVYKKPVQSRVVGSMQKVEIFGDEPKTLKLVLSSNDDVPRDVVVSVNAPNEVSVDSSVRQASIPSKGSVELEFQVSSMGALPGSRYVVYAVVDYSDQVHYSVAVRTNVEITEKKAFPVWVPVLVLVILILVVVYMQLNKKRGGKKK